MRKLNKFIAGLGVILASISCNREQLIPINEDDGQPLEINLSGNIDQVYQTRANDQGFCDGDVVGIYVVDYENGTAGTLLNEGNRADNVRHTFNEADYKWNSAFDIYWKDKKTNIDVYGYYPFSDPSNVKEYAFSVQKDQSTSAAYGKLGGYEASDFLWGKAENIAPTDRVIRLGFKHKMASVRVSLVEGTGFGDGEWAGLEKQALVLNTKRDALVDLSTGEVKATGSVSTTGTIPYYYNGDFRAVVVPQTLETGANLISVTVGGIPYIFRKDEAFTYNAGKQHNFTITVNKRTEGGVEFVMSSESITAWENDAVSHDATSREYIIIDVQEPGTLEECLIAAGKDPNKVRNLKLTGRITSKDFAVMRYKMTYLSALNLKEVQIVAGEGGNLSNNPNYSYRSCRDSEIPATAMYKKESLTSLVLPETIKYIDGESGGGERGAFAECTNLSGSLIIPEGVIEIGYAAFRNCTSLTGTLSLPSTLKKIGQKQGYTGYHDGVFYGCNFVSELLLPEGLETIGIGSFDNCKNLYGELRLPDGLLELGERAFYQCKNLSGSLEIPQGITNIPIECFEGCGMGGTLSLHDGITTIGNNAFSNNGFKGELRLPKDLEVISHNAFYNNDFSGELILPKGLRTIGDRSFAYNWRLMGTLEIPENVLSIGAGAFAKCRSLEGVIFPEGLESIRFGEDWYEDGGAFQDCFGIGRIVCKGDIPAYIQEGSFHGVPKDNFTLEVPEHAIPQYQAATGWKEFKRISAYRNLVIRPSIATAINTSVTRDLVLTADNEWIVESQPDWVTLSKTSGTGKQEIKLTFSQMPQGTVEGRSGEIVFKLKDKDYRTRCKVTQYDYEYAEDQIITLQTATKGAGVNLVFLGDGYNAKDINEGKQMKDIKEAVEHYFNIEPYKTYRDYFNVYTGIAVSAESGIGSVNTIIYNRFNTSAKGGVSLGGRNGESDFNEIFKYATKAPTVDQNNLDNTLIVMIPNTHDYGGICYMYDNGAAIAYCPMSDYGYPLDTRGVIQHEAGGHGFGKLGDEYIYHNAFIDACGCNCCPHDFELMIAQSKGWFQNLSLTGKMHEVPWSHLIFHEKYSGLVDIFEGGYMHSRGVYRSEQNSCMNNDIPYYSTISREEIVKRIMAYAGEEYSFEKFVANDVIDATIVETKSSVPEYLSRGRMMQSQPVFMGAFPELN